MERCVVLNNQHQSRIDEFALSAQSNPSQPVIFQPYSGEFFKNVDRLLQSESPVPLFLVTANFGNEVTAMGILNGIEDASQISQERKDDLLQFVAKEDDGLYSKANILLASNIKKFHAGLDLSNFLKETNNEPLKPGRWPCSVCYVPTLIKILQVL